MMLERISGVNIPNLFLLNYRLSSFSVLNLTLIPKQFFVPEIIERRKPLSRSARRAGWTGCNILVGSVPASGKIVLIENENVRSKIEVLAEWQHTLFLRDRKVKTRRTWLLDVMKCIENLDKIDFSLSDIYSFESRFAAKYSSNGHVREKLRQQLQILRDNGYLEFSGHGRYKLVAAKI